ncbi:MAG: translocation/assembly module TamB domain-containing protein, partial [Ferruginibacter sp.]|nr:translocation/assembly module TamB domain-containing protein [Ferruginibacter sp.]
NQTLNINTELRGNLQRLYLPYLQMVGLSGSKISANGTLFNITDPKRFSFDLNILQSNIYKKDLMRFVPPANQAQLASLPDLINVRGRISGNKNSIAANVSATAKDLAFTGKVNLFNITDPKNIKYDLAFTNVAFNKSLIEGFIPPAALAQINLPQQISAAGKFSGNTENVDMDLKARSSYGPLTVKGYMKNIKNPEKVKYDLYVTTPGFAIGKLIKQDSIIGNVAGAFTATGTGFNYLTMTSAIKANVASLQYNKYNYRNAKINADFNNGLIKSIGRINDSSLQLTYDIVANVRNKYPTVKGEIDVDTAMLNKLNFTKDTINFSLRALVDAANLQPRSLDASLLLDSVRLQTGQKFLNIDSTSLIATSLNGIDSIVLKAPFADVHAGGAFDYDKIGESIMRYVNNYYKIPGYKPTAENITEQQFAIKGSIKQSPVITTLVPGLNSYQDFNFRGSYASADVDSALNFNTAVKNVSYATNNIANAALNINAKNARINYEASFDTLKTAGNTLYGTRLNGAAAKDSLSLNVVTKDNTNRDWFGLSGTAFVKDENYTIRMQDSLILNYEKWRVAPDNYISYGPAGIVVNNFVISSDTAKIDIRSKQLVGDSPIDISIDNFNLKSISSIVNKDTVLLAGILDMKATVSDLKKELPSFTGNASITDVAFMQYPLGTITATAQKQSENNISATVNLLGVNNDISASGNYYLTSTTDQFDADLQVKALSFKTLEAFSANQLVNSRGNISGNLKLNGQFANPQYNGQLNFDTVKFSIAKLGTPYFIDKQKIVFKYPQIQFPAFNVTDSLNNVLKIDGDITSRSVTDYDLNVDFNANDFIIVNAKKTLNNEIYGFASVDVNVSVTGTSARPNIEGDILLNDKSDIKIVLPQASYAKNDGKTIVRFVDADTFKLDPPQPGFEPAAKPASAFAQFLNYNLNIELTKAAALTILIDPSTGDEIKVQGDARLNAGVDPGGNLVLAGTYELDKGYYDLHYQILQRKFNLIKGSTITFAGAPLDATANITAEYIANTSSRDLLSNEVTDVTPNLANSFNQKIPFKVILYLTGPLSKPDIAFDIQLPEESNLISGELRTTIENKLLQIRNDPASINKQVFSLLLFNRFVSEQSSDFFKGNGGDFNDLARQSVSQFLSSALNEIAGDIFKGIDIDLNLNSYNDFSNGGNTQRTDLNLAVSKSFANDRLIISVGKNFGIEGQNAAGAGANAGFTPDVTVAYKLTTDGKYLFRAYTKNQMDVTLDGYVIETGVSFVVTMDYDNFNEFFRRKKKEKN